eukprot:6622549-Alexandrium_andersonii.AAC.1
MRASPMRQLPMRPGGPLAQRLAKERGGSKAGHRRSKASKSTLLTFARLAQGRRHQCAPESRSARRKGL